MHMYSVFISFIRSISAKNAFASTHNNKHTQITCTHVVTESTPIFMYAHVLNVYEACLFAWTACGPIKLFVNRMTLSHTKRKARDEFMYVCRVPCHKISAYTYMHEVCVASPHRETHEYTYAKHYTKDNKIYRHRLTHTHFINCFMHELCLALPHT
jgi:hypothetical protein